MKQALISPFYSCSYDYTESQLLSSAWSYTEGERLEPGLKNHICLLQSLFFSIFLYFVCLKKKKKRVKSSYLLESRPPDFQVLD